VSALLLLLALASIVVQIIGLACSPMTFLIAYPITVILLIAEHIAYKNEGNDQRRD